MNATENIAGSADESGAGGQNDLESMLAAAGSGGAAAGADAAGRPIGLQITGGAFDDTRLLAVAAEVEAAVSALNTHHPEAVHA